MAAVDKARGGDKWLQVRRTISLFWTTTRFFAGPAARKLLRLPQRGADYPVRIRLALEQLGLTYLKLGQYLATRFDILPPEVCRELGKLFEDVPPMTYETAAAVVESELHAAIDDIFVAFQHKPIAAASVAQVHEARLQTGERVAVKIQRPGIERFFRADIKNSRRFTNLADRAHLLGRLSATEMLDEFATWTLQETKFVLEGSTAERVGENRAPYEVIPKVYWELTTEKVLTLEFIEGISLAQIDRLVDEEGLEALAEKHPHIDIDLVLHHLTFASLRQIFDVGLFHGDPHPGNILVMTDNRVAFVDFGIFGELSPFDRDILGGQIENLALGNIDESLRFYVKQLTPTEESDPQAFRQDARAVLAEWYDVSLRPDAPIAQRHIGKYMFEMINISRRHRLLYDMSYLLYWRALNALDSTALRLSDQFDLIEELRAFFEQLRPDLVDRAFSAAADRRKWGVVASLARTGPDDLDTFLAAFAEERYDGCLLVLEPPKERRRRQDALRWVVTAVVSTSVLALSAQADLDALPRLAGVTVGALLAVLATVRTNRG